MRCENFLKSAAPKIADISCCYALATFLKVIQIATARHILHAADGIRIELRRACYVTLVTCVHDQHPPHPNKINWFKIKACQYNSLSKTKFWRISGENHSIIFSRAFWFLNDSPLKYVITILLTLKGSLLTSQMLE